MQKHLLVDGSNVMHAWPELKAQLPGQRDAARYRLSLAVSVLHDTEGLRVSLVFDGRGGELVVERPSGQVTFTHLYTPTGVTADEVIAQLVEKSKDAALCVVATDDRGLRQAIEAMGAACISTADLASWVRRVEGRVGGKVVGLKRANDQTWRRE